MGHSFMSKTRYEEAWHYTAKLIQSELKGRFDIKEREHGRGVKNDFRI